MKTVPLCLLTVIAESVLKKRLIHDVREAGARGYTIIDVEGEGTRQRRVGEILGANIRLETIVSPEVAERLLHVISSEYWFNDKLSARGRNVDYPMSSNLARCRA